METDWNRLAPPVLGADISDIMERAFGSSGSEAELYGQGDAAEKIVMRINEG